MKVLEKVCATEASQHNLLRDFAQCLFLFEG
jgi:hypothetical protein